MEWYTSRKTQSFFIWSVRDQALKRRRMVARLKNNSLEEPYLIKRYQYTLVSSIKVKNCFKDCIGCVTLFFFFQLWIDSKNPKRYWSFIKFKAKSKFTPPVVQFGDDDDEASTASDEAQLFNTFFASVFLSEPAFVKNSNQSHRLFAVENIHNFTWV